MTMCRKRFSMAAVIPIFVNGGINLALGVGWTSFSNTNITKHFRYSWFIGVCFGAICAAPVVLSISNRFLMYVSSFLTFIAGLFTTALPDSGRFVLVARYINGFAVGLAILCYVCSISELSVPRQRGRWMSFEALGFALGILLLVTCQTCWSYGIYVPINLIYGITYTLLAILALLLTSFYVESPLYYMRRKDFLTAAELLQASDNNANCDSVTILAHNQEYIEQNKHKSFGQLAAESWWPLLRLIYYRSILALSFSWPLNINLKLAGFVSNGQTNVLVNIVYALMRYVAASLGLCVYDNYGRKFLAVTSLTAMAGLLLGIGIIFNKDLTIYNDVHYMSIVCILAIGYQFFAGLYAPTTSIYLSEAFPMPFKPYLIATCVVVEQFVYIIIVLTYYNDAYYMAVFSFAAACLIALGMVIVTLTMPETRNMTLLKAQQSFQTWFSTKMC